jgi:hypothetical protein
MVLLPSIFQKEIKVRTINPKSMLQVIQSLLTAKPKTDLHMSAILATLRKQFPKSKTDPLIYVSNVYSKNKAKSVPQSPVYRDDLLLCNQAPRAKKQPLVKKAQAPKVVAKKQVKKETHKVLKLAVEDLELDLA